MSFQQRHWLAGASAIVALLSVGAPGDFLAELRDNAISRAITARDGKDELDPMESFVLSETAVLIGVLFGILVGIVVLTGPGHWYWKWPIAAIAFFVVRTVSAIASHFWASRVVASI